MKTLLVLWIYLQLSYFVQGQSTKGRIIVETLKAPSLHNVGGEDSVRRLTIYLPPGYGQTANRYPVIYYLHGFSRSDSLQIAADHLDQILDKAITSGRLKPVIVVIPNHHTLFKGSWFANSSLTGNWVDFMAKDLVSYIDTHYRTIQSPTSRGIAGHSMGGYGALKLGMLFPDVFGSVYALSPSRMALLNEFGPAGDVFKQAQKITTKEELFKNYRANLAVAMGRALSPNPNRPPFYCDLPYTYQGDSLLTDQRVVSLWNRNSPLYLIDSCRSNLKKLTALKLDWGRNDESSHIPLTCRMFSQKLEALGIEHYAEEYIGTHINKLWTEDGRATNDVLPFFNTYLRFEKMVLQPISFSKTPTKK